MKLFWIVFFMGAGLMACSSASHIFVQNEQVVLAGDMPSNSKLDSLITPYRDSLSKEMDQIIAQSNTDFVVGRPGSNLGNWVADAIFYQQTKNKRLSIPVICLLNTGGLRASLNKGSITVGDIYKLMPFDNLVVWAKLPKSALSDIEAYLIKTGGEPIANATLSNGKLKINGWQDDTESFWVITSDYLINGGDKMEFFKLRTEENQTGELMRDELIAVAKEQKILKEDSVVRIKF